MSLRDRWEGLSPGLRRGLVVGGAVCSPDPRTLLAPGFRAYSAAALREQQEAGGTVAALPPAEAALPPVALPAEQTPEDEALPEDAVLIPTGSILRGVLLSGMDAPTGRQSRRDPCPALARIKHDAILPNRFRADVRECFLALAGYGDLGSERAYLAPRPSPACARTAAPSRWPSTPTPPTRTPRSGGAGAW